MRRRARGPPRVLPFLLAAVSELDCVDNQRVAFPVAASVAQPLRDAGVGARVQGDDRVLVVVLVQDRDVIPRLEDLVVIVVAAVIDLHAVGDAAFAGVHVGVGVVWTLPVPVPGPGLLFQ